MGPTPRRYSVVAALLAGLAAAVTLGHLLGPHSQSPLDSHSHFAVADLSHCHLESVGHDDDHPEVNYGALLLPAASGTAFDAEWSPGEPDPPKPILSPSTELGPNGRAPPSLAELQVNRV